MLLGLAIHLLVAVFGICFANDSKNSCLRFGGGSCCPVLNALDRSIEDILQNQPEYITFLPLNDYSCNIDNICLTFFPLPDDSQTILYYSSTVYNDGSNEVETFVASSVEPGVRRVGNSLCQVTITTFAEVACGATSMILNQRCTTFGDCPYFSATSDSNSKSYGVSSVRQPISRACLSGAKAAITINGLPEDDYYILPMRLPSRCVLNQVCTAAPALQRFCQTVGVAFPSVNRCASSI